MWKTIAMTRERSTPPMTCADCTIENRGPRNPMTHAGTTVMDLHVVLCPLHEKAEAMLGALYDQEGKG